MNANQKHQATPPTFLSRRFIWYCAVSMIALLHVSLSVSVSQNPPNQAMRHTNGQWMERQDNPTLVLPVFTAECWVKAETRIVIVSRDIASCPQSDWSLVYDYSRQRLEFMTQINSQADQYWWSADNSLNSGAWNHVTLVANGPAGQANVYINGGLVITATFTSRQFNVNCGLAWAGYYNNAGGAQGRGYIDEARYWNIERTQAQIQNAMNARLALNDRSGLAGYWMFCGNFADSSGNGNHGVPRNNPQIVDAPDLPVGLACSYVGPKILTNNLPFRAILCPVPNFRDSSIFVKNTGDQDLVITKALISGMDSSDFRLISPLIPPYVVIKPGDSSAFLVRFLPGSPGSKISSLVLESNATNGPFTSIMLTGTKEILQFSTAPPFIQFGQFHSPPVQSRDTIRFTNNGSIPITLTQISFAPQIGFTILTPLPITLNPSESAEIVIEFNAILPGIYRSLLKLKISPCDELLLIPMEGSIIPNHVFQAIICPSGDGVDTTFTFTNNSDMPITLVRSEITGPNASDFTLRTPQLPPSIVIPAFGSTQITVRYHPVSIGNSSAQLALEYQGISSGSIIMTLGGSRLPFSFGVTNRLIDFGQNLPSQLPKEITFSLQNRSSFGIYFSQESFAIGTGYRLISSLPENLQPGKQTSVRIRFDSTIAGIYQSILRINTNPCDSITEIPVVGNIFTPVRFDSLQCANILWRDTLIVVRNFSDRDVRITSIALSGMNSSDFIILSPSSMPPPLPIPPRDSLLITIRFQPSSTGMKNATLEITYECIVNGVLKIPLSGAREDNTLFAHAYAIDFGVAQLSNLPLRKFIVLHNPGRRSMVIERMDFTPPFGFSIITKFPLTIRAGESDTVRIEFRTSDDGLYSSNLVMHYSPCDDSLTVSVKAILRKGPIAVFHPLSFRPLICASDAIRDSVLVINNIGTDTLIISQSQIVGANAGDFQMIAPASIPPSFAIAPRDSVVIAIRFIPSAYGDRNATLLLQTNMINPALISISLSGRKESMGISISATSLDFGMNTPMDLPKQMMLLISNHSSIDRTITKAAFSPINAFQSLTSLPLTIPAGGSRSLIIQFSTNIDGDFFSRFQVTVSPCDTMFEITTHGNRVTRSSIFVSSSLLSLALCENQTQIDTTIMIKNSGGANLTLRRISITGKDSSEFLLRSPTDFPVLLSSGDSLFLNIRITPQNGVRTALLHIESDAVNASFLTIPLQVRKDQLLWDAMNRTIDLGVLCPDEKSSASFSVQNQGATRIIASMDADAPMNLSQVIVTVDSMQNAIVTFDFNGIPQEGTYAGKIRIHDQCGREDTLRVTALISKPSLVIDPMILITDGSLTPIDSALVIRNVGSREVLITSATILDSHFLILTPPLPWRIVPGAMHSVRVRYTPTDTLPFQASLNVSGNPCSIAEQGSITILYSSQRSIRITSATHGTLRCETYRDTTITIFNMGFLPVQLQRIEILGLHASDFSIVDPPNLPQVIVLPRNALLVLTIRFSPSAAGLRNAVMEITSDAANAPHTSIPLLGRKEDVRITVSTTDLSYGVFCPMESARKTVAITNMGTVRQRIAISSSAPFTTTPAFVDLDPGQNDSVIVNFNGVSAEGLITSKILITNECNEGNQVSVSATVIAPLIAVRGKTFASLVDSFDIEDVVLINPTTRSITVTSITIFDTRFTVTAPSLPFILQPNASIGVQVTFSPTIADTSQIPFTVQLEECAYRTTIPLIAQAYEATATIALPSLAAGVDTMLTIPMRMMHANNINVSGAQSFRASIRFNRTMLKPVAVRTNSATASAQIISNTYNETDRTIIVEVTDVTPPRDGVILMMDCITALGNAESTPLHIENFSWITGRVRTMTIDGEYISTGLCREGGVRLLHPPMSVQLQQNFPNPFYASEGTTISFSVKNARSSSHATISLYDLFGRFITTISEQPLREGLQQVTWKLPTLASGMYIYKLQSQSLTISRLLSVRK